MALAGCQTDVKTDKGVTPEALALANGHKEISDLLQRLSKDGCAGYIQQLIPRPDSITKIKMKVFGNCNSGKSTLIESMRCSTNPLSELIRKGRKKIESLKGIINTSLASFLYMLWKYT